MNEAKAGIGATLGAGDVNASALTCQTVHTVNCEGHPTCYMQYGKNQMTVEDLGCVAIGAKCWWLGTTSPHFRT